MKMTMTTITLPTGNCVLSFAFPKINACGFSVLRRNCLCSSYRHRGRRMHAAAADKLAVEAAADKAAAQSSRALQMLVIVSIDTRQSLCNKLSQ